MTYDDHIGKKLSEAGGIQDTIDAVQDSPERETFETVDLAYGTVEDILDVSENGVQGLRSTPDGAEVG